MQGVTVFHSLDEAVRYGYEVCDRISDGYLVRTRTSGGFAFALVMLR